MQLFLTLVLLLNINGVFLLNTHFEDFENFTNLKKDLELLFKKEIVTFLRDSVNDPNAIELHLTETAADIDEFVDKVVIAVRDYIGVSGYNNITLPDQSGIKLKPTGKLNLLEGSLSGLTSMQRYGHATVTYDSSRKRVSFEMILRFTEIDFIYKYHSKILFISSTGHLHGKVEKLKIHVNTGFDFNSYQAFVDDVDIKETGTIDISLSGNSGIDWFTNTVLKLVTSILHPVILNIVTQSIRDPINSMVNALNQEINQALHPSV